MVDILSMVDLTSISAMLAAIGVLVGVVFAILELRNIVKTRQTDIVLGLYSILSSKGWLEAWEKVNEREIVDWNDYKKKHGFIEINQVAMIFEQVGILLHRKLIDISLVYDLYGGMVKQTWEKTKPLTEQRRTQFNRPDIFEYFEYLYNEMQKREQKLTKI